MDDRLASFVANLTSGDAWRGRRDKYSTKEGWLDLWHRIVGTLHSYLPSDVPALSPLTILRWLTPVPNLVCMKMPAIICLFISCNCMVCAGLLIFISVVTPWYYRDEYDDEGEFDRSAHFYFWGIGTSRTKSGVADVDSWVPLTEAPLGGENTAVLQMLSLIWLVAGVAFWFLFVICWWGACSNRTFNLWSCPGPFYSAITSCGTLATCFFCFSWIAFCFWPLAHKADTDTSNDRCDSSCVDFAGDNSNAVFGPHVGWSFVLVASVMACCTVLLFKIAFSWDARGRSWIHSYNNYDNVSSSSDEENRLMDSSDEDLMVEGQERASTKHDSDTE